MPRYALIVENDAGRAARYVRVVEDAGAVAAVVGRSEEALSHVRRAGPPAVVLVDHVLPADSGLSFLRSLRELVAEREAPAVVVADSRAAYDLAAAHSEELNVAVVLTRWHPLSEVDRAIRSTLSPALGEGPSGEGMRRGDRPQPLAGAGSVRMLPALPPHVDSGAADLDLAERLAEHPVVERLARARIPDAASPDGLQRLAAVTAQAFGTPLALVWVERGGRPLFAAHPRQRPDASLRAGAGSWASLRQALADAAGDAPFHVEDAQAQVFLRSNPLVSGGSVRCCAAASLPGAPGRSRGTIALASAVPASIPRELLDPLVFWTHRVAAELPGLDLGAGAGPRSTAARPAAGRKGRGLSGALGVGAIVSDDNGQVTFANAAVAELLPLELARLTGMRREAVLSLLAERTDAPSAALDELARAAHTQEPRRVALALRRPRRRTLRWETKAIRYDGHEGRLDEIVDVTAEAERAEASDELVRIDAETGLPNRRAGEEALEREISSAVRRGAPLGVALFEVTLAAGPPSPEEGFRSVAWLLRDALRGYDLAVRFAGRQLLAILPGARGAQAAGLAERFRARIQGEAERLSRASIVFGVAEFDGTQDVERLLSAATTALSAAVQRGSKAWRGGGR